MNNTVEGSESSVVTGQSYLHQVHSKTASKEDYALRKVPLTWRYSWSKLVVLKIKSSCSRRFLFSWDFGERSLDDFYFYQVSNQ